MKDNIDFNKITIPFDRQNAKSMMETGRAYSIKNPLSGLGITCIGDDCCDTSMVYDNLHNKCVMSENFGNFFEKQNANVAIGSIVYPNSESQSLSQVANKRYLFESLGGNSEVVRENFESQSQSIANSRKIQPFLNDVVDRSCLFISLGGNSEVVKENFSSIQTIKHGLILDSLKNSGIDKY